MTGDDDRSTMRAEAPVDLRGVDLDDAVEAIERKEGRMVLLTLGIVAAVIWAAVESTSPLLSILVVVLAILPFKATVRTYLALVEQRKELLEAGKTEGSLVEKTTSDE